ncbi:MAG: FAD-binding protein, partial [Acidimicrobiia bacterium]|nr:FAD-binding protein [Acidimicrobiia bacterium]
MAIERDMTSSRLSGHKMSALQSGVRGQVLLPGDEGYDAAREVWNAAVDRRPALIVQPRDAADVQQVVAVTQDAELPLAIRGGGHSTAGHGTVDDGVVIDLSMMKGLTVDPGRRVAWAEPGLTWGEYNTNLHGYGLATPGGDVASVGIAGL